MSKTSKRSEGSSKRKKLSSGRRSVGIKVQNNSTASAVAKDVGFQVLSSTLFIDDVTDFRNQFSVYPPSKIVL
jgi:hypothetical protein